MKKIKEYAPELAKKNEGFDVNAFARLYEWEKGNFWFTSRNDRILNLMVRFLNEPKEILEIGCGTGYVLEGIKTTFRDSSVVGSEIFTEGLKYAQKRNPDLELIQMDARKTPFNDKFNAIGMFDVLEHIEEDDLVLKECYKALVPNGKIFISVPQHMFLWSAVDELACHKRRYSRRELLQKLKNAGFKIEYWNSFTCLLMPLMYISRLFQKKKATPESEFQISPILNTLLKYVLWFEFILVKLGLRFPFGGSLIVVASK